MGTFSKNRKPRNNVDISKLLVFNRRKALAKRHYKILYQNVRMNYKIWSFRKKLLSLFSFFIFTPILEINIHDKKVPDIKKFAFLALILINHHLIKSETHLLRNTVRLVVICEKKLQRPFRQRERYRDSVWVKFSFLAWTSDSDNNGFCAEISVKFEYGLGLI